MYIIYICISLIFIIIVGPFLVVACATMPSFLPLKKGRSRKTTKSEWVKREHQRRVKSRLWKILSLKAYELEKYEAYGYMRETSYFRSIYDWRGDTSTGVYTVVLLEERTGFLGQAGPKWYTAYRVNIRTGKVLKEDIDDDQTYELNFGPKPNYPKHVSGAGMPSGGPSAARMARYMKGDYF